MSDDSGAGGESRSSSSSTEGQSAPKRSRYACTFFDQTAILIHGQRRQGRIHRLLFALCVLVMLALLMVAQKI